MNCTDYDSWERNLWLQLGLATHRVGQVAWASPETISRDRVFRH
jgi:hypothetical protein